MWTIICCYFDVSALYDSIENNIEFNEKIVGIWAFSNAQWSYGFDSWDAHKRKMPEKTILVQAT